MRVSVLEVLMLLSRCEYSQFNVEMRVYSNFPPPVAGRRVVKVYPSCVRVAAVGACVGQALSESSVFCVK